MADIADSVTLGLELRPVPFEKGMHDELAALPGVDDRQARLLCRMILAGEAMAFRLVDTVEKASGLLVLSIATELDGARVMHIGALSFDQWSGLDITEQVFALVFKMARKLGVDLVRCWTVRPGLVRKLERRGATVRSVVELGVNDGR